jgi:CRISPR-associated protein (TIGR02584 family)
MRYIFDGATSGKGMLQQADRPGSCERRVLLAVTGLSPQIVTETLYALAVTEKPTWIPSEIRIITTLRGAAIARDSLLADDPGWIRRLCADYGLPEIAFGADHIHGLGC